MKALASNQTINWFFQRFKEDSLELSPDFQRNPVWQQLQKDYLIETLILELPMPEVYMVNRIKLSGESTYVVVDGQQRLRTILEFITGNLELKTSPKGHAHVKHFTDLLDTEKQKFWRYPIVVRDLEESSDADVRELFQRLNKYAMVLNEQELRNARFKGAFLRTVQEIGENKFWTASGVFSSNDIRRMIDLEFISILICTMMGGVFNRKERLDEFYLMYEDEFEEASFYKDRFQSILEVVEAILPNIKKTRWSNKADFYTLFLTLDKMGIQLDQQADLAKISHALSEFSASVDDARENEKAAEQFRDYLDAAVYATNDKEKRVRRHKILTDYLAQALTQ